MSSRILRPALLLAAAAGLAACSNYGDRGYGYSRVSLGVGSHSPYYGWYDDYYYPGTGYYIYDRHGSRHRWSDRHRRYWEARRGDYRGHGNWSGYHPDRGGWDRDGRHDRGHAYRGRDRDDRHHARGDRDRHERAGGERRNSDRNEWRRNSSRRDRR